MSEITKLDIELREDTGKGAARALRRAGQTPAIIYGGKSEVKVSLSSRQITLEYNKGGFLSTLVELTDGKKTFKALPREVQLHPVTDIPLHADFLQVEDNTEVTVKIKVDFINADKSPGIKLGGILGIVRHKVELRCKANAIPLSLTADLEGRKIGDSVHISAIELPDGVTPTIDRDFTIATITGRKAQSDAVDGEGDESEGIDEAAAE